MDQDYTASKFDRLKRAVLFMRRWQLEFRKFSSSRAKENARRWEKEVDDILREEIRRDKTLQQEIF